MSRGHVCMVVHGPYPLAEPRVEREARAAVDAGFEVDVIAMSSDGAPAAETVDGVDVTRLPIAHVRGAGVLAAMKEYARFTARATALLAARSLRHRYDIVQIHNPPDFLFAAALLPKALGSKTVFDIHDFAPEMFGMRFGSRHVRHIETLLRGFERVAARLADEVVTVHEPYRRELARRGVPKKKLTIVMNTLDERVIPADRSSPNGHRTIITHGTITPHYGIDVLIDALARVAPQRPDVRAEIIGAGDAVPELRNRITAHGLSDLVRLDGCYLPHPDAIRAVAGASVGVVCNRPIPRNALAVPTKLFEFVALGVPVVTAGLPAIREHFSSDEVTYFAAGDSASLADALASVLDNPAAAAAKARAARERYDEYSWAANARTYIRLLERLVRM